MGRRICWRMVGNWRPKGHNAKKKTEKNTNIWNISINRFKSMKNFICLNYWAMSLARFVLDSRWTYSYIYFPVYIVELFCMDHIYFIRVECKFSFLLNLKIGIYVWMAGDLNKMDKKNKINFILLNVTRLNFISKYLLLPISKRGSHVIAHCRRQFKLSPIQTNQEITNCSDILHFMDMFIKKISFTNCVQPSQTTAKNSSWPERDGKR